MTTSLPQTVKNLPIDTLRMFTVLADIKSISATAQIISRSQPAVSLQLKKLEETLATPLFSRHKGTFALTRNGELLLRYATQILALNDQFMSALEQHAHVQTIRIGMPNDFLRHFWSQTLAHLQALHPNSHFEVYEDLSVNLMAMLHQNQLDVALTLLPKAGGQYCQHSVAQSLYWAGKARVSAAHPLPLLACFNGCSYRTAMESALKKADIPYRIVLTSNNFYTLNDAITQGLGVSALLSSEKNHDKFPAATAALPVLPPLYLGLHVREANASEEMTALVETIKSMI